jgi:hypothetical protein
MKTVQCPGLNEPGKPPAGILGLDEITGGGLPRGLTTLLVGGPSSGKTIVMLPFLVHGASLCKEPGTITITVKADGNATMHLNARGRPVCCQPVLQPCGLMTRPPRQLFRLGPTATQSFLPQHRRGPPRVAVRFISGFRPSRRNCLNVHISHVLLRQT